MNDSGAESGDKKESILDKSLWDRQHDAYKHLVDRDQLIKDNPPVPKDTKDNGK